MAILGKNLNLNSTSVIPSAYRLNRITITNHRGQTADIQNIAVRLSIQESIYSNTLYMKLTLKDSSNFLERFPLIGQEKINLLIDYKRRDGKPKTLNLDFFVTEYPLFGSDSKQQFTQIYSLIGVSEQAFISQQKKISKRVSANTSVEIQNILFGDLNLSKDTNKKGLFKNFRQSTGQYDTNSIFQGIINTQSPLSAIEWLKNVSKDSLGSPFFFFQTLNGKYRLYSYCSMMDDNVNANYHTYYDFRNYSAEAYSEEDYFQRASRVLSVESDLRLNKTEQSNRGAFASRNFFLDYGTKSFTKRKYSYFNDFYGSSKTLESYPILSSEFKIDKDNFSLDNFNDSHQEFISINSKAYSKNPNYNTEVKNTRAKHNAYHAIMDTMSHDIRLNGDFKLNAGRKITLFFPKGIDPTFTLTGSENTKHKNEFLSGKYIITSAIHEFENDEYFVNVRVKRDSFSKEIGDFKDITGTKVE